MKKKVSFDKKIEFPTMIGEITEVSLENNLKFINDSSIEGNLILIGKYKLTEASRIEEDFKYDIPVEVNLSEKLDLNTTNIEISDFYYEIEDEKDFICHIELSIDGLEIIEELEENRECDGDNIEEKEIEIPIMEKEETKEEVIEEKSDSLFGNLDDSSETYGTFIVNIVRQNESINSIIEKYHTTIEDLQKYNDINNIDIGSKIIIPFVNE